MHHSGVQRCYAQHKTSPPKRDAAGSGGKTNSRHREEATLSDNRVLLELIELGIETSKQKEQAFFELAERFRASKDAAEAKQLGDELGRMVFGE